MLKIVGLSNGEVADEKILLTEDNKLTVSGIVFLVILALAAITVFSFIYKVIRWIKK